MKTSRRTLLRAAGVGLSLPVLEGLPGLDTQLDPGTVGPEDFRTIRQVSKEETALFPRAFTGNKPAPFRGRQGRGAVARGLPPRW